MELCPFSLEFQSRTTVKSQALVDFIAEWTDLNERPVPDISDHWAAYGLATQVDWSEADRSVPSDAHQAAVISDLLYESGTRLIVPIWRGDISSRVWITFHWTPSVHGGVVSEPS